MSNESNSSNWTFFDDLTVSRISGKIKQETHYYPYGLAMADIGKEGSNPFGYQAKEWQTDLDLELYDFHARQFDPTSGRFFAVDPAGQFASDYVGMGNNPVIGIDPDGEFVLPLLGSILANSALSYAGSITTTGQRWNWGDFGLSVAMGFAGEGTMAGVSLGVSSGLSALGLDAGTANFVGGLAGGFGSGSLLSGGVQGNISQLAGPSLISGISYSNPFINKGSNASSGSGEVIYELPEITITADRLGNTDSPIAGSGKMIKPIWWGDRNYATNSVYRASQNTQNIWGRAIFNIASTIAPLPKIGWAVRGLRALRGVSAAKGGKTIVGEGMKRVSAAAAKNPGSTILNNMPKFSGAPHQVTSKMMQYNRKWILQQMRSGRPIMDIGLDPTRGAPSIFYQMEQNMMKNYLKLHPGAF